MPRRRKLKSNQDAPQFDGTSEIQEIQVLGDWAFMWTKLSVVMSQPGGAAPLTRAGHTLSILKKENGKWVLARDANLLAPVSKWRSQPVAGVRCGDTTDPSFTRIATWSYACDDRSGAASRYVSAQSTRTGLMSTTGVPSMASIGPIRYPVPEISHTFTRLAPTGSGGAETVW